jgi:Domain of unknown function (DUF4338)
LLPELRTCKRNDTTRPRSKRPAIRNPCSMGRWPIIFHLNRGASKRRSKDICSGSSSIAINTSASKFLTALPCAILSAAKIHPDHPQACILFNSVGWRMTPRDQWIGWSDKVREANFSTVVNNARFLIFPWVEIPNLASHILSLAARQALPDWEEMYKERLTSPSGH